MLWQEYFKPGKVVTEPVSVLIVPPTPPSSRATPSVKTPSPKTLEKLPTIREPRQPKDLTAIPKGNRGETTEKQKESASLQSLKTDRQFTELSQKNLLTSLTKM